MKTSPGKRNFETIILALGILIAVVAAISISSPIADGRSTGETVTVESGLNSSGNSCQYLKILTIN